ncbi:hypothetical protein LEN26_016352 [Aphanomyces euteiches]|nr:hypothetical protein LEN26_016352 [Aphanomyces euteiches]
MVPTTSALHMSSFDESSDVVDDLPNTSEVPEGWIKTVDEHGTIVYQHVMSGHCQAHMPVVDPSMKKKKSRRSISHRTTSKSIIEDVLPDKTDYTQALRNESKSMVTDYLGEVEKFNAAKPYARQPDNSYLDTLCICCKQRRTHMVFFPCQHKCMCDLCIKGLKVGWPPDHDSPFRGCPVCQCEVTKMFEHTGHEQQDFWDWAYEVKPYLSAAFEHKFKMTGRMLGRRTSTGAVVPTNIEAKQTRSRLSLFHVPMAHRSGAVYMQPPQSQTNRHRSCGVM